MTNKDEQENGGLDFETLEVSFAAIAPDEKRLVERFYEELFERHPAVMPLFEGSDMKSQRAKLLAALKLVIANVRNMDALLPALQELGQRHQKYGAEPEHYIAVADVLISVMAEIAGDQWTQQTQQAWRGALNAIAGIMLGAYTGASAAPRGARARSYRVLINRDQWRMGKISRASVADFLVKQIDDNTCLGKIPLLIN